MRWTWEARQVSHRFKRFWVQSASNFPWAPSLCTPKKGLREFWCCSGSLELERLALIHAQAYPLFLYILWRLTTLFQRRLGQRKWGRDLVVPQASGKPSLQTDWRVWTFSCSLAPVETFFWVGCTRGHRIFHLLEARARNHSPRATQELVLT